MERYYINNDLQKFPTSKQLSRPYHLIVREGKNFGFTRDSGQSQLLTPTANGKAVLRWASYMMLASIPIRKH